MSNLRGEAAAATGGRSGQSVANPPKRLASGHAKTQEAALEHRHVPVPVRRPREVGGVAPAPPPNYADADPLRASRIYG